MTLRYRLLTDETGQTYLLDAKTSQRVVAVRFRPDWQGDTDFSTAELMLTAPVTEAIAELGPHRMAWTWEASLGDQYLELSFVSLDAEGEGDNG